MTGWSEGGPGQQRPHCLLVFLCEDRYSAHFLGELGGRGPSVVQLWDLGSQVTLESIEASCI